MDLYAKLAANMEELAGTFDSRMHHLESDIKKLSSSEKKPHKDLETLSREFTDFKSLIWKSFTMMRSQLELLVLGLDRQETASRRKVLLFHGISESSELPIESTIIKILHNQFKMLDIGSESLSVCHRLGTNTSKARPVLVRFADYKLRSLVWDAKTALKGSTIAVSEFLTKSRHDVFAAARSHFGVRRCWTSEGKIIILLPDNKRRRIESMSELKPLLVEFAVVQSAEEKRTPGTSQDNGKTSALITAKTGRADRPRRTVK